MSKNQKTLSSHRVQKILEAKPRLEDAVTKLGAKLFETYVCLIRENADEGALGKFESLQEELGFIWNSINPPPELVALRNLWDEMAERRLYAPPEEREQIIQELKAKHAKRPFKTLYGNKADWVEIERDWRFGGAEWQRAGALEKDKSLKQTLAWMEQHPELAMAIVENRDWMTLHIVYAMFDRHGLSAEVFTYFLERVLRRGGKEARGFIGKLESWGEPFREEERIEDDVHLEEEIKPIAAIALAKTIKQIVKQGPDKPIIKVESYATQVLMNELKSSLYRLERKEIPYVRTTSKLVEREKPEGSGTWIVLKYDRNLPYGKQQVARFSEGTSKENKRAALLYIQREMEEALRKEMLYDFATLLDPTSDMIQAEAKEGLRLPRKSPPKTDGEEENEAAVLDDVVGVPDRHEDVIEARRGIALLARCIALLPKERLKRVARHRFLSKIPRKKIADDLGVSISTIKRDEKKISDFLLKHLKINP